MVEKYKELKNFLDKIAPEKFKDKIQKEMFFKK